ncbi:probable glycosidase Crh1p [Trichomonascus vanleenenianus]|uniref:transglycosylase n=1 Tax=Trichomonascus vanleenenianus TaxID=2268995 RepID=UPI003EC95F20
MRASVLYAVAASIAAASAQTYTKCDPLTSGNCPADPALGKAVDINFQNGASDLFSVADAGYAISYGGQGAEFTITKSGDNPTIQSNFYLMFGRVEVVLQAAPGTGIVSSFVLQSDDLDEVDLEWLGGDTTQVQSNWFSKGDTSTYDRGAFHPVNSPQTTFHNYTVDWTDSQITWYIDNQVVRVLESNNPEGYPQTPMFIRIGSWAGGDPSNPPGTIEWAGGTTDYNQGPFHFYVLSLFAQDYSTGTEYVYGDRSGSWQSIQAVGGQVNGNEGTIENGAVVQASSSDPPQVSTSTSPAASSQAAPTTTSTPDPPSTTSTPDPPSTTSTPAPPTTSSSSSSQPAPTSSSAPPTTPTSSEPASTPAPSSSPSPTSTPPLTTSEPSSTSQQNTNTQQSSEEIPSSSGVETSSPLATISKSTSVAISSVESTTSFQVTASSSNSSPVAEQSPTESAPLPQTNDGQKMKYSSIAMVAGLAIAFL